MHTHLSEECLPLDPSKPTLNHTWLTQADSWVQTLFMSTTVTVL